MLKNKTLLELANKFGSQAELGRQLGLCPSQIGILINSGKPTRKAKWWNEVCDKLFYLTGKLPEEIFDAPFGCWTTDFLDDESEYHRVPFRRLERITSKDSIGWYELESLREHIAKALKDLNYTQRGVIVLRFGLEDGRQFTYAEVAKVYRYTKERIRQIEEKALRIMQESMQRNCKNAAR